VLCIRAFVPFKRKAQLIKAKNRNREKALIVGFTGISFAPFFAFFIGYFFNFFDLRAAFGALFSFSVLTYIVTFLYVFVWPLDEDSY
jgi:hypothetical protein